MQEGNIDWTGMGYMWKPQSNQNVGHLHFMQTTGDGVVDKQE